MRDDLAKAGIKPAPYFEEVSMPFPLGGDRFRQSVPPGDAWERLCSLRAPCEGRCQVQIQIHWSTQELFPNRSMLVMLEVNQIPYYEGLVDEDTIRTCSEVLDLATDDVVSLYVSHDSPRSAEVEYSIFFTRMDSIL